MKRMWTYANQLTILRMAFVPVFILMIIYGYPGGALAVFFLAGLTDMLDGLIARRFGQNSELGTVLDPIADKLLLTSAFVVLSMETLDLTVRIPLWLTITVISRDFLLVISVLVINLTVGRRLFPPSILGKATTVFQLVLVLGVLFSNWAGRALMLLTPLIYLALALTVLSGVHYLFRGMRIIAQEPDPSHSSRS